MILKTLVRHLHRHSVVPYHLQVHHLPALRLVEVLLLVAEAAAAAVEVVVEVDGSFVYL
jgi:hypothetical protein